MSDSETVWMHGDPESNYHDLSCKCDHHCRYCFNRIDNAPRRRYCSEYCQRLMKAERALDRRLCA